MTRRTILSCVIAAGMTCSVPPGSRSSPRCQAFISAAPYFDAWGFPGVPSQALIEWHVDVVAAGPALVIIDERQEHFRVVVGAEDALDDDVEAVTERVPRLAEPDPVTPAKLALFRAVKHVGAADGVIGSKCGSCDEHVPGSGAQGWRHFCVLNLASGMTW